MLHYEFDDGERWSITFSALEQYRDYCLAQAPRARPFAKRIATCFWLDLYVLDQRYHILPREVLDPIISLEEGETVAGLKPATQFRRKPLQGLWHKHWTSSRFMAANLLAAMVRDDPEKLIWEIANEGDLLNEEIIEQIVHRFTTVAYEKRWAANQITGEWIVFLKRDGLNYYLCLGTHQTGDERLHDKIRAMCFSDFPNIDLWLAEAANTR